MAKVKLERSLELAERILMLNKINSDILIMLINEMELNELNKKREENIEALKQ